MSKTKKTIRTSKPAKEGTLSKFNLDNILPQKYHIPAVLIILVILFLIFLNPLFFGNQTFQSGDIITMESAQPYAEKEREGFSLWTPYIFCGMPAYAVQTEFAWFNLIALVVKTLRDIFSSPFAVNYAQWTLYLIIMAFTTFFFVRHITKNTLVSLFAAVAVSFCTGIIVFLYIGHVTKLISLAWYPLLFLILFRMQDRIRFLDIMILIITLQLLIQGFHVQIIFYTLIATAIYFIYFFLRSVKQKDILLRNNLLKSAGIFIGGSAIAFAIQADNFTQISEYSPYSTRGTQSITEASSPAAQKTDSDFYEYHTNWSFSPEEVLTFIVPSFYGFGNVTYQGPLTNGQEVEVNTYFGQMLFVDVAMYMGVLVFFLGLFAIFADWKNPIVRFLTILSAFALLVSFGRNFPVLFDLMFYYFPYFDRFRVPSMILVLVQMSFPVLAAIGLMKIISLKSDRNEKLIKAVRNIAFVFTAFFVLSLLLNSAIADWFAGRVNEYAAGIQVSNQQLAQQHRALAEFTAGMFVSDLLIALAILTGFFWLAAAYINSKISADFLVIIAIVFTLADLWRIDARGAKYEENPDTEKYFQQPDYITAIKNQDNNEPYRLINIKQDRSLGALNNNGNFNSYFLEEDFYGYSGIKPRAYQDYMDVIGPVNLNVWRMLNVKYVIADQPAQMPGMKMIENTGSSVVYENEQALPRVYFVNSVETKPNLEFLRFVKDSIYDPKKTAFIHEGSLAVDAPDSTASISFTKYTDEVIELDATASGNNFIFLGNTYIPSGWKAYIGDNQTEIHRTNHGFMGIVVPQGNHKVKFEYAPDSFFITKNIALILSSLVLAGLILGIFLEAKKKKQTKPAQ
jgi:hypothetical protein